VSDAILAAPPLEWRTVTVERKEARTPRVVSIFVQAGRPRHAAGQHVDVRLTAPDGYRAERSYSIASAPGAALLELAVERLEDGEVSPWFHDVAAPGDAFELRGPIGGHFAWEAPDGGPLLLIGGGSGVVPLVSILRHRARVAPDVPALLLYSSRTWDDVIFRDELLAVAGSQRAVQVVFAITRGRASRPGDLARRIDRASLRDVLAAWGQAPRHVYVGGANRFVETMAQALVDEGVDPAIVRTERYGGP
jgi:ferredoxin-NADP reductase